jgi:hypothetical protein
MKAAVLFALWATTALAQPKQANVQVGTCNQVSNDNNGTITINCTSIDPKLMEEMKRTIAVLDRIAKRQADPAVLNGLRELNQKMDEVLRGMNPNLPVKTYFCDGTWRTAGPGPGIGLDVVMGGDSAAFESMRQLNNSGKYVELLRACQAQIESDPGWLTPYLFCGLGHLAAGNTKNAREMFEHFDSQTGPGYDVPACRQMSEYLRQKLK